jgi:uncharacterized protein YeaO (DUF488 family)
MVKLKRAYEPAAQSDGKRVLVERLWPRGVSKQALRLHGWLKDVAPSDGLRRWFGHDPARFREFAARYRRELRRAPAAAALEDLARVAAHGDLTLVYAARDEAHNSALVLREEIEGSLADRSVPSHF